MTGSELISLLERQQTDRHCFIRWWQKDKSIGKIELLDTFLDTAKAGDRFESFELLDMEGMWTIVMQCCPGRVAREIRNDEEVLVWERIDLGGCKRKLICQFAPEFLIQLFVVETAGDYYC